MTIEEVLDISQKNYKTLAKCALEAGSNKEAVFYSNKILETDINNWRALLLKGTAIARQIALDNNCVKEASYFLSQAINACPIEKRSGVKDDCIQELSKAQLNYITFKLDSFFYDDRKFYMFDVFKDVDEFRIITGDLYFKSKDEAFANAIDTFANTIDNRGYAQLINKYMCMMAGYTWEDAAKYPTKHQIIQYQERLNEAIEGLGYAESICEDYNDNETKNFRIQIFEKMIELKEKTLSVKAYEVDYSEGYPKYDECEAVSFHDQYWGEYNIEDWKKNIEEIKKTVL